MITLKHVLTGLWGSSLLVLCCLVFSTDAHQRTQWQTQAVNFASWSFIVSYLASRAAVAYENYRFWRQ